MVRLIEIATGAVFTRLTVKGSKPVNGRRLWICECECGQTVNVLGAALRSGNTKSCGCYNADRARDRAIERNTTHGQTARSRRTPTYRSWSAMMTRCTNPNIHDWHRYGGRGIRVFEPWRSFEQFLKDVGGRPSLGHSIDRFPNVDGNYEPGNVRWATIKEQSLNKRRRGSSALERHEPAQIRWLASEGISQTTIAKFFGIAQTMVSRIVLGKVLSYW